MSANANYKLSGRVDSNNAQHYENEILVLLDNIDQTLTIDLSELNYISSVGLRVFLKIAKALKQNNKKLVIAKPNKPIQDLLVMSGFDKIIDIQN